MKTPEEIKLGLECCSSTANCADGCPYHVTVEGSLGCDEMGCDDSLLPDALALIQQLEWEVDSLKHDESFWRAIAKLNDKTIDEQMALIPRWIPVEERLPEKWMHVLAYTSDGYRETMVYDGHWWWQRDVVVNVTHWMPLPEPPEED